MRTRSRFVSTREADQARRIIGNCFGYNKLLRIDGARCALFWADAETMCLSHPQGGERSAACNFALQLVEEGLSGLTASGAEDVAFSALIRANEDVSCGGEGRALHGSPPLETQKTLERAMHECVLNHAIVKQSREVNDIDKCHFELFERIERRTAG